MTQSALSPQEQSQRTRALCELAAVIPVLTVPDASRAADLGRALISGGLTVLEVTLRTDAGLDAIRAMAKLPGGHVGAGTVLTRDDVFRAKDAGATFAVSPGLTDPIVQACIEAGLPILPGVSTASEAMRAADYGFTMMKFFPASAAGGTPMLKALSAPLAKLHFCPTGGISLQNAAEYLSCPNVVCVGGSWIATPEAQANGDWSGIEVRAREAATLPR